MTTPDKPTDPIMGGLRNFGTHFDAWTGGKPNSDWTGLDKTSPLVNNPNQLRSYTVKARSAFNSRRNGLYFDEPTRRFKSGGNLDYFCQTLRTALLDNGMDTVCYRKDPLTLNGTIKMVDVLGCYHRLNRQAMQKQSTWFLDKFDQYDRENDKSAIRFLLNSLQPELKIRIETKMKDDDDEERDTFVDVFFIFLEHQRPPSADLFESITNKIKKVHPSDFPGEDIEKMAECLRPDIQQLIKARAWDSKNNIHLCRVLTEAGGETNQEYKGPMFLLLDKVKKEVSLLNHLSNQAKASHMAKVNLGWNDILEEAEYKYKEQVTDGFVRWPPACHNKDSKAAPAQLGYLSQSSEYPEDSSSQVDDNQDDNLKGGDKSESQAKKTKLKWKNPKLQPPGKHDTPLYHENGEPVYEKKIQGRDFQWCKKCARWTVSHNTGTHTGGSSQVVNHFAYIPSPSIWFASHKSHLPPILPSLVPSPAPVLSSVNLADPVVRIHLCLLGIFSLYHLQADSHTIHQALFGLLQVWAVLLSVNPADPVVRIHLGLLGIFSLYHLQADFHTIHQAIFGLLEVWVKIQAMGKAICLRAYFETSSEVIVLCSLHAIALIYKFNKSFLSKNHFHQADDAVCCNRQICSTKSPTLSSDLSELHLVSPTVATAAVPTTVATAVARPAYKHCVSGCSAGKFNVLQFQTSLGVCNEFFKYPKPCPQVTREYSLIWDSGSSLCVSGDKTDFPDGIHPYYKQDADSFGGGIKIEGVGTVHWFVKDLQGDLRHLKLPAYFVPGATQRLISPQVFCSAYSVHLSITHECWRVKPNSQTSNQADIDIFTDPSTKLPTSTCLKQIQDSSSWQHTICKEYKLLDHHGCWKEIISVETKHQASITNSQKKVAKPLSKGSSVCLPKTNSPEETKLEHAPPFPATVSLKPQLEEISKLTENPSRHPYDTFGLPRVAPMEEIENTPPSLALELVQFQMVPPLTSAQILPRMEETAMLPLEKIVPTLLSVSLEELAPTLPSVPLEEIAITLPSVPLEEIVITLPSFPSEEIALTLPSVPLEEIDTTTPSSAFSLNLVASASSLSLASAPSLAPASAPSLYLGIASASSAIAFAVNFLAANHDVDFKEYASKFFYPAFAPFAPDPFPVSFPYQEENAVFAQVKSHVKSHVSSKLQAHLLAKSLVKSPVRSKIKSQIDVTQEFPHAHIVESPSAIKQVDHPPKRERTSQLFFVLHHTSYNESRDNNHWFWDKIWDYSDRIWNNDNLSSLKPPLVLQCFMNNIKLIACNQSFPDPIIDHLGCIYVGLNLSSISEPDPSEFVNMSAVFPDTSLQWPLMSQASNFIHHLLDKFFHLVKAPPWSAFAFSATQLASFVLNADAISAIIPYLHECTKKGSAFNSHAKALLLKVNAHTRSLVHQFAETRPTANPGW